MAAALSTAAMPRWPDNSANRAAARAAIEALQLQLMMQDSATLVLDEWCRTHGLAPVGSKTVAEREPGMDKPASAEVRAALQVGPDEPVRYRRVRLKCGDRVLSNADNWYVPARLDPAMNVVLETTDTSFGRVVRPLRFTRRTLSSHLLWPPMMPDWPADATGQSLRIPAALLENRAVLSLPDGRPISLVVETYTDQMLAFAPPAP